MKVKKFLYSLLLMFIASFFAIQPTLAITAVQLEMFVENNIMFYDPEDTYADDCYTSSAHLVNVGDLSTIEGREAYIWNWLVKASIPGVSDHAEVIAGILGNFKQENSEFDPFAWGGTYIDKNGVEREHARGIFRAHNANFNQKVESVFGSGIWDTPLNTLSNDAIQKGLDTELEFMISSSYNWNGSNFLGLLDVPAHKAGEDGAAAYAELFMLVFERPAHWAQNASDVPNYAFLIEDSGVAAFEKNRDGENRYRSLGLEQGKYPRRTYWARHYYNKFANNDVPSRAQTTVTGSDVTIIGDETISSIESSLQSTLSGIDIKIANNITNAADLVKNDSSIRKNVFLAFDLSKELIGEDNLTNALSSFSGKTLYFILNTNSNNNDNYSVNDALIHSHSDSYQIIRITNTSIPQTISDLFTKPITTVCGVIMDPQYLNAEKPISPLYSSSASIPCANNTEQVVTSSAGNVFMNGWHGGSKIEGGINLCYLPANVVTGSTYQTMDEYNGKTFSCGTRSYTVPNYKTEYMSLELNNVKSGRVIVNSRVAGAFLSLATHLRTIIGKNEPLNVLSSFRSVEFQKLLYGVTPYGSDCEWNGYKNAGEPGKSGHNGGFAVDLDLSYLTNSYNNSSIFKQYVDQYISANNITSNSCASADFSWSSREDDDYEGTGRWDDNVHKYLCATLKDFGFYFTVNDEPWHVEAREK